MRDLKEAKALLGQLGRRVSLTEGFMATSDFFGGAHDGALDTRIGHATAEIAVHVRDDFGLGGIGVFGEQRSGLHDLPGLAVAALWDLLGDPRALQRVLTLRIEAFDSGDFFTRGLGDGGLAGSYCLAVDVDSTGATQTGAATELRAGHLQMLADDPQ